MEVCDPWEYRCAWVQGCNRTKMFNHNSERTKHKIFTNFAIDSSWLVGSRYILLVRLHPFVSARDFYEFLVSRFAWCERDWPPFLRITLVLHQRLVSIEIQRNSTPIQFRLTATQQRTTPQQQQRPQNIQKIATCIRMMRKCFKFPRSVAAAARCWCATRILIFSSTKFKCERIRNFIYYFSSRRRTFVHIK